MYKLEDEEKRLVAEETNSRDIFNKNVVSLCINLLGEEGEICGQKNENSDSENLKVMSQIIKFIETIHEVESNWILMPFFGSNSFKLVGNTLGLWCF